MNDNGNLVDVTINGSTSFKYKSSILGNPADNGVLNSCPIEIPD